MLIGGYFALNQIVFLWGIRHEILKKKNSENELNKIGDIEIVLVFQQLKQNLGNDTELIGLGEVTLYVVD